MKVFHLWHKGLLTLLFLIRVQCFVISRVPCYSNATAPIRAGVVSDTALFTGGCSNFYLTTNMATRTWTNGTLPPLPVQPFAVYSEEAQAIFLVGSDASSQYDSDGSVSFAYYNITTNTWTNKTLTAPSIAFSVVYYQNYLFVARLDGNLDIYNRTDNYERSIPLPFVAHGTYVVVDDLVYYMTKPTIDGIYSGRVFNMTSRTLSPPSFNLTVQNDANIDISFLVGSKIVSISPATNGLHFDYYDIKTNQYLGYTISPLIIPSPTYKVAVAQKYAFISLKNADDHRLFKYSAGDDFLYEYSPPFLPFAGDDYILLVGSPVTLFDSSEDTFQNTEIENAVYAVYGQNTFYIIRDYGASNYSIIPLNPSSFVLGTEIFINKYQFYQAYALASGIMLLFKNIDGSVDSVILYACTNQLGCRDYCGGVEYCNSYGYCALANSPPCVDTCQYCNAMDGSCTNVNNGTVCSNETCNVKVCSANGMCNVPVDTCPATATSSSTTGSTSSTTGSSTGGQLPKTTSTTSTTVATTSTSSTTTTTSTSTTSFNTSSSSSSSSISGDSLVSTTGNTTQSSSNSTAIIASVVSIVGVILLALIAFLLYKRYKRNDKKTPPSSRPKSLEMEMPTKNVIIKDIVIEKTLASGNFGDVYKGTMDGNVAVALKTLKSSDYTLEFQREVNILSALNHPNVVRLYGVYENKNEKYMVFEYLSKGSLNRLLIEEASLITETMLLSMALQIASGMKYLESNKIIHRDLALRNVLVTTDSSSNYTVKIGDFGMSRSGNYYKTDDKTVPVRWSAPEFIEFGTTSSKSDAYSFGVCLWELFSYGAVPYGGLSNSEVIQLVKAGKALEMPTKCTMEMYKVMLSCWKLQANERPSFEELFKTISELSRHPKVATPEIGLKKVEDDPSAHYN